MRFPELHARDLDGRSVTVPDDLGPGPTLLLVRFTPASEGDVETWYHLATDLGDTVTDFWCYDVLVLPAFPDAVQPSLTDELRSVTDAAADVRSLTVHTDVAAFRRALVLDRAARTYALLLHDGRVRWRAFGPLTAPLERSLRTAVDRLAAETSADDIAAS
jgi:hypothetical protein